ncbi:MAG: AMP-binding protein [Thermoanaerobaculia bacterium]|nr:AMP-binding protein [Thermoanaerobaculia bacterium]
MPEKNSSEEAESTAEVVLEEVRRLIRELDPEESRTDGVHLDSSLGSDLGIDSLGRAELISRLEDRFDVALPERVITEAETPRDLAREVGSASPDTGRGEIGLEREEPTSHETEEERDGWLPDEAETLAEVLAWHVDQHADRRHILYLEEGPGEGEQQELTYGELADRARAAAAAFQAMGLDRGGSVGLMLPTGLDYFASFLGIQLAGGVPVPLYPPMRKSQLEDHLERQTGILDNARVKILVTFEDVEPLAGLVRAKAPELEEIVTPEELAGDPDELRTADLSPRDTAFLQYTSGSTGDPKGVVLSHANLLANLRSMEEVLEIDEEDVIVSWLPLYHDMGLIGAWMGSLYFGVPLVLMSPLAFLSRPVRWLRAIHKYRGTLSAAPNFAYELCLAKIDDDEASGLDLSSWRLALNGAEPVSPRAVEEFPAQFEELGLEPRAILPVYGLAECSLAVTFSEPGERPVIDTIDRERFQRDRRAEPLDEREEEGAEALRFVSCGRPIPHHEVRFVDADGREVAERQEGRLQFKGPSATSGYFRNPGETERLMRADGWLDSEDLGYSADGRIYLTGRSKDVIIRAGRNIYPQEVEDAVGDLAGVRRGCVAVFAAHDRDGGGEKLVVLAETRLDEEDEEGREELEREVAELSIDLTGTAPDEVVLVPPRVVPKTSSGKLRRSAAQQMYEADELDQPSRPVWLQIARLALSAVRPALGRVRRRVTALAYAVWFWSLAGPIGLLTWLAVCLLPSRSLRRRTVRRVARLMARLTGTSIECDGLEHLDTDEPRVITANHASYLDGFVLAAVLPPNCAYLAKEELEQNLFTRLFLARLGCVFVERFDPGKGEEESSKAAGALERGDHLVVFPEGTFQRAPGLLPFRMGAFVVAAENGAPVVPVTLRGTRSKMRGSSWFPRPGNVRVTVAAAVEPDGEEWEDAVALRNRVRAAIFDRLAEPDLA